MSWVSLTAAKMKARLAVSEITSLSEDEIEINQTDPLTQVTSDVVQEVRGFCSAGGMTLGTADCVPDFLLNAAINRARFMLGTRFPRAVILDDDRRKANDEAMELFKDVAKGDYNGADTLTAASGDGAWGSATRYQDIDEDTIS